MTVVEIIGMQQVRIHTLEERMGQAVAMTQVLANELKKRHPEDFNETAQPEDIIRVIQASQPLPPADMQSSVLVGDTPGDSPNDQGPTA
jgi:hypothetical protein